MLFICTCVCTLSKGDGSLTQRRNNPVPKKVDLLITKKNAEKKKHPR